LAQNDKKCDEKNGSEMTYSHHAEKRLQGLVPDQICGRELLAGGMRNGTTDGFKRDKTGGKKSRPCGGLPHHIKLRLLR